MNAWKTLSARIRASKIELQEMGEETEGMFETSAALADYLKQTVGVNILEEDGKTFRNLKDIIVDLGKAYENLEDEQLKQAVAEKLAGKTQMNVLLSAISNYKQIEKAYDTAVNSAGSAQREQENYAQSVQYSIDRVKASLEELAYDTLNSKFLKSVIEVGNSVIQILDEIIEKANGLPIIFSSLASGIMSFKGMNILDVKDLNLDNIKFYFATKKISNIITKDEIQAIQNWNKELINTGATGKEVSKIWSKNFKNVSNEVQNYVRTGYQAGKTSIEIADSIRGIGTSSKLASVGINMLNFALNAGIIFLASKAIEVVVKLATAEKNLAQRAQEAASAMNSTKEEMGNYRSEVDKLSQVLKDENSTTEEKIDARRQLFNIQKDLIKQYGDEETAVGLINSIIETSTDTMTNYEDSINKVATAWENLELKAIEAAGRESDKSDDFVRKGYNRLFYNTPSSFEANNRKYEDYSLNKGTNENRITVPTNWNPFNKDAKLQIKKIQDYYKELGGTTDGRGWYFEGKSAKETLEIYEKILTYAKSIGITNKGWLSDLENKIGEVQDLINNTQPYRDAKAEAYIAGNYYYSQAKEYIEKQYEEYEKAKADGDEILANRINSDIQKKLSEVQETANSEGKAFIADWFGAVYAEIQSQLESAAIEEWFTQKTNYKYPGRDHSFNGTNEDIIKSYVNRIGTTSPDDLFDIYSAWEDGSINDADNRWNNIAKSAGELFNFLKINNIEMSKFVELAQQRNILDTQDEALAKKRFGEGTIQLDNGSTKNWSSQAIKDWIDTLSPEDLEVLLTLKLDPNYRYTVAELTEKVQKAKEDIENNPIEVKTEFNQTAFASSIDSLKKVTAEYDKWQEQIEQKKKIHLDITEVDQLRELVKDIDNFDFDNFESILTSSDSSVAQINQAFNELYDAILKSKVPLEQINAENKQMIQTQLEESGMSKQAAQQYVNGAILRIEAGQKVNQQLAEELEKESEYRQTAGENAEIHNETVQALLDEANQLGLTNEELVRYVMEMGAANGLSISGDYSWLIELCTQIGIAIDDIYALKSLLGGVDSSTFNNNVNKYIEQAYQSGDIATAKKWEAQKRQYSEGIEKVKSYGDALTDTGSKARRAADDSKKAGGGAGKAADAAEDAKDALSEVNSELDDLQDNFSKLKKIQESYNKNGKISIDQAQELSQMDFRYLATLKLEGNQLNINEDHYKSLAQAKMQELKISMMRKAIDLANSLKTEADAVAWLNQQNATLALTDAAVTEAEYAKAMSMLQAAGGARAEAAAMIQLAIANAMSMMEHVDYSTLVTDAGEAGNDMGESMGENMEEAFEEEIDWIERRLETLDQELDILQSKYNNMVVTANNLKKLNKNLDQQMELQRQKHDTNRAGINYYQNAFNEAVKDLAPEVVEKIKHGVIEIEKITDETENDAINKAKEIYDKIQKARAEMEKIREEMGKIAKQKFDNIVNAFQLKVDRNTFKKDLVELYQSISEARGEIMSDVYYRSSNSKLDNELAILEEEYRKATAEFGKQLKLNRIKKGDQNYNEMLANLEEMQKRLVEIRAEQAENIRKIYEAKEALEDLKHQVQSIQTTELEDLYDLLDTEKFFDDEGKYTDKGITGLGLLAQRYTAATADVENYRNELSELMSNKEVYIAANGAQAYYERLDTLQRGMYDAAKTAEEFKKQMLELHTEGLEKQKDVIQDEIDSYKELIDAMKEALDAEKDLHDYQKSLNESNKKISKVERKLAAMQNDNSAATVAKRKQLEAELKEYREELEEKQYDRSIQTQKEALDKDYENFKKSSDKRIAALDDEIKNIDTKFNDLLNMVSVNSATVAAGINQIATETGVIISSAIVEPWNTGAAALENYRTQFQKLRDEVQRYADEDAARQAANNATAEATNPESDVKNAAKESIIKDVEWLISHWDKNKNAKYGTNSEFVKRLKQATKGMEKVYPELVKLIGGIDENNIWGKGTGKNVLAVANFVGAKSSVGTKKVDGTNIAETIKKKFLTTWLSYLKGHAKGVHNLKRDELAWTQELGSEAILSPTRKAILTPLFAGDTVLNHKDTENLFKLAKLNISDLLSGIASNKMTPVPIMQTQNGYSLHIDNLVTVNGNVSDDNVAKIQQAAEQAVTKAFTKLRDGLR